LQATPTWKWEWLRITLYVLMGWSVVVAAGPLMRALPAGALALVFFGGIAYTVGIVFYCWRSLPFHHAVWHGFVLLGSLLHFLAVWWYVIP
jgi:hemolysin III